MGLITGYNKNNFISAELIYSKIKREWKSIASANLIDDGEFPVYTMEVLEKLGLGAFREAEDILLITNGKTKLPCDLKEVHSLWKCDPYCSSKSGGSWVAQPEKNTVRYDTTTETVCQTVDPAYDVDCSFNSEKILERVTVQQYVNTDTSVWEFRNPRLMRISPNVKPDCFGDDCLALFPTNDCEYSINDGYLYTNFTDSSVYLKYYAYPTDDDGYPMIPNNINVRKAVEWWIKYQLLLNYWFDSSVSDIERRWGKAELEYEKAYADARYDMKLPAFATLMNAARDRRGLGALTFFAQGNDFTKVGRYI